MTTSSYRPLQPQKFIVEAAIRHSDLCHQILRRFPRIPIETIPDANVWLHADKATESSLSDSGTILLAKQRGPFLRLCPGTQRHICCLYHNLDIAAGCDLSCSYCILQGYLNSPIITLYCNLDDMYRELDSTLRAHGNLFYRIGTGELSDSLTFDHINHLGPDLVGYFSTKSNAIIELKTKSIQIENLLGLQHHRRTVVSWSLNSEHIQGSEESLTPTMDERLAAAQEIQRAGYRLGFHFDPMIYYPNWETGYREIVEKIFRFARAENIAWISLGALRYPQAFDDIVRNNHPNSEIVLGELLPGIDKKLRYFRPLRIEMFRTMNQWIKKLAPEVMVYLCMESKDVWNRALGWSPRNSAELKRLLDDRVRQ